MKNTAVRKYIFLGIGFVAIAAACIFVFVIVSRRAALLPVQDLPNGPTYVIGFLSYAPGLHEVMGGFQTRMDELSKENGFSVQYRSVDVPLSADAISRGIDVLLEEKVDLIVTGQAVVPYVRTKDPEIPVVSTLSSSIDDLESEVIQTSDSHNTVFLDTGNDVVAGDRLLYFLQLMPQAKRILVPHGPEYGSFGNASALAALREAARKVEVKLVEAEFLTREELNAYLLELNPEEIDAVYRFPDSFISANLDIIYALARQPQLRKPVIALNVEGLKRGAVLSYGTDWSEFGVSAAEVATEILHKKVDANLIPTRYPYNFRLGINVGAAKSLGLEIPVSLLMQADHILQENN